MKFKLDENLPVDAAKILSKAGYDAHTVLQENLIGKPDSIISETRKREERILITLDTDFCNILNYPPSEHPGIIVIRSLDQSKQAVLSHIHKLVHVMKAEPIDGKLWIMQNDTIRIR